jgi:serine/threonine protein kinase
VSTNQPESEQPQQASADSVSDQSDQATMADTGQHARLYGIPVEFGRYRLEKVLGEGAMGRVYLALDTQLNRRVALKVPRFASTDSQALERFLREARAAALLRHSNICPIYDVGEQDGFHFLTMAFIEGNTLTQFTTPDNRLSQSDVAILVAKLARAMHEAHLNNVVHRDLKPDNVMIDLRSEPVIMDFGLARRECPGDETLTREGAMMGTPAYMSPEQMEGVLDRIGPATDIYALGVILFELVAGRRPFVGSTVSLAAQVLRDEAPSLLDLRPDADHLLIEVCAKCLNKQPEVRFATGNEMAAALDQFGKTTAPPRIPASPKISANEISGFEEPLNSGTESDEISTYLLAGLAEADEDESSDANEPSSADEAENKKQAKRNASSTGKGRSRDQIVAGIQNLLGKSKLSRLLVEIVDTQPGKAAEQFGLMFSNGCRLIQRELENNQHSRAVAVAAAMHLVRPSQETLNELVKTTSVASLVNWNPDDPQGSLKHWTRILEAYDDRKIRSQAAKFACKQALVLCRTKRLDAGIKIYQAALKWENTPELKKQMRQAFRDYAEQARAGGKPSLACRICKRGLKFFPKDKEMTRTMRLAQNAAAEK